MIILLLDEDIEYPENISVESTNEMNQLNVSTRDEVEIPLTQSEQEGFYENQLQKKSLDLQNKVIKFSGKFKKHKIISIKKIKLSLSKFYSKFGV